MYMFRKRTENIGKTRSLSAGGFFIVMSNQETQNRDENKSDELDQEGEAVTKDMRAKAFRIALEMIAVFGIPAVTALVIGGRLEVQYGSWTTYVLLAIAFVTSWVIVYIRVRSFARQLDNSNHDPADKSDVNESNHG